MNTKKTCFIVSRDKKTWDMNSNWLFATKLLVDLDIENTLEKKGHYFVDNLWFNLSAEVEASHYIEKKYLLYRGQISEILNNLHDKEYDEIYWGKLIDVWLLHLLPSLYDRLNIVNYANLKYPDLFISCENKQEYHPPIDTWDFVHKIQEDELNSILYMKLCKIFNIDIVGDNDIRFCPIDREKKYKGKMGALLINIFFFLRKPVFLVDSYFTKKDSVRIMLRSLMRIVILPSRFVFLNSVTNVKSRKFDRNKIKIKERDLFDKAFNVVAPLFFPQSFLEKYQALVEKNKHIINYSSAVGSATGIRSNDQYKIIAAEIKLLQKPVLGFQHGGGYGCFKWGRFDYAMEFQHADVYYKWRKTALNKLATPKLRNLSEIKFKKKGLNRILFVSTTHPKHVFYSSIRENPHCFPNYLYQQFNFYESLNSDIKRNFYIRNHHIDHGWSYKARWNKKFDDILFDEEVSFISSLKKSQLYISDHISTTWLEALAYGIPMIMFFNIERYGFTDEFESAFQNLLELGVVHETSQAASNFINKNYTRINQWWELDEVKNGISQLKRLTISHSDDFVKEWCEELSIYKR